MGWNSWDSYGFDIDEQQFRASAQWVAEHLKPAGYRYVTIDQGWYVTDPKTTGDGKDANRLLDQYGRYLPAPNRFPSAADGKGFAPLADYIHSLGLQFGLHIVQGIPRAAVAANTPIEGSSFHARDAANTAAGCQWSPNNWDLQDAAAGQAYYDSIVRLYASWHVDLIKIDCIASRPYKGEEIRMFHEAIAKSGRRIVLSLSPGAAPLDEAANLQQYSRQWRISDDIWDVWQSTGPFPQGVNDQIARAARWLPYAGPGHWPDLDMLPLGQLRPSPGWGDPRATRLTHDEQRSMMTLWSIVRAPLIYGGNAAQTDAWTLALLTNPEVIALDQHSEGAKNVLLTERLAIYTAKPGSGSGTYAAIFNRQDTPQTIHLTPQQLQLSTAPARVHDLWHERPDASFAGTLDLMLAPHASVLLSLY